MSKTETKTHNELFHAVVEHAPEAIVIVDGTGRILVVNSATEALFGASRDELVGEPVESLMPERYRDGHRGFRTEYTEKPHVRGLESGLQLTALHSNGTEFPVEISLAPLPIPDGTLGMATIREVTPRRKQQMAAEKIAARLAEAQEMAHVGSFEIDLETGKRWWSDELWRMLGMDRVGNEASKDVMVNAIHPEDVEILDEIYRKFQRHEAIQPTEYRMVRPDGDVRWVRTRAHVEQTGRHTRPTVIGTTMDITDLREAFRRQREAEKTFELSFDHSPIGMAVVDFDGYLQLVNPALCTMLGRYREDLLVLRLQDVLTDEDGNESFRLDDQDRAHSHHLVANPDGTSIWVDVISTLVKHDDGTPAYYFVQVQDISDQKREEATLMHHAFHDALTGLPNRLMLMRRLDQALDRARRTGERAAVLFLDVDQFKPINDTLGHDAGDLLLVLLTQRLSQLVRGSDMLARFGGDEMVIVCDRMTDASAAALADRVAEATREPFALAGREVLITVSIGITLATGYEEVAAVLRSSDSAMYEAKLRRSSGIRSADRDVPSSVTRQTPLYSELAQAVERNELTVVYQPLVRIADQSPIGFEALLRWNHPERGPISPLEFIPVAEASGLLVPIGEWVLQQAVAQVHGWRSQLPGAEALSVSVNVSAVQMLDPGFVPVVEGIIDEVGIDPGAVILELTESIVMNDIEKATGGLESLRSVGVEIAIDDFGTGYSSLAYLRDLPVNSIKIDRSFVQSLDTDSPSAAPILRAIIGLADAVQLASVAEGVETEEQLAQLREFGVQFGQGYLWSKPLPADEVPGWLAGHGPAKEVWPAQEAWPAQDADPAQEA
ncbi:EAL domain-containing protein [Diaminobutyricimonas sp. LJ205]|uniref:sensor domain-containing protein n=1 Tax=Diaminobutyricimonas sp. LJ205 TaxID=2683590 RepID=UPI0012F4B170|nr:EAL domain-containing protein [Diaminobutyricimonas sp. LJ205]